MADQSLESVLGYVNLTGRIQSTVTGIPDPLPAEFSSKTKPTLNDEGRYTQVTGTRTLARRVEYGSPALNTGLKNVASKDVKLLHLFERIKIDVKLMNKLRNYTSYDLMVRGADEILRQIDEFNRRFDNARIAARLLALSLGHLYFDSDGNLLNSSSGNSLDIDYGINATTNMGQFQDEAAAAIITASWATASTDIGYQLRVLKKTALRRTGYRLKKVFYGEAIPSYVFNNNFFQPYLARHEKMRNQYDDTGEIPNGLWGFEWIPAYEAFYENKTGTNLDIWNPDRVTFTPDPSEDWWENMEGTYPVPTTWDVQASLQAVAGSFDHIQGKFSYASADRDVPAAGILHCGDTYLPIIKVPNAVYIGDVTP